MLMRYELYAIKRKKQSWNILVAMTKMRQFCQKLENNLKPVITAPYHLKTTPHTNLVRKGC